MENRFSESEQNNLLTICIQHCRTELYRYIYSFLKDTANTKEVLSQVFECACIYIQASYFENDSHCLGYLFTVAKFKCMTFRRSTIMERYTHYEFDFLSLYVADEFIDPFERYIDRKKSLFIYNQLHGLPSSKKQLLFTYLGNDCNMAATARALSKPATSTQNLINKFIVQFRNTQDMDNDLKELIACSRERVCKAKPKQPPADLSVGDAIDYAFRKLSLLTESMSYKHNLRTRSNALIETAFDLGFHGKLLRDVNHNEFTALVLNIKTSRSNQHAKAILYTGKMIFDYLFKEGYADANVYRNSFLDVYNIRHSNDIDRKGRIKMIMQWLNQGKSKQEIRDIITQQWNISRWHTNESIRSACAVLGKTTKVISSPNTSHYEQHHQ